MTEFKGTKGKWEITESSEIRFSIIGVQIDVWTFNEDGDIPYEEAKANAQLISKAPEMHKELVGKHSYIEELAMLIPSHLWTEEFRDKYNKEMNRLEKLIEEATSL